MSIILSTLAVLIICSVPVVFVACASMCSNRRPGE